MKRLLYNQTRRLWGFFHGRHPVTATAIVVLSLVVASAAGAEPTKAGIAGGKATTARTFTWRMQVLAVPGFGEAVAAQKFAQLLKSYSHGQIQLSVYPNNGLGLAPASMVNLTATRAVDVGELIGALVEPSFPEIGLLSVPGLVPRASLPSVIPALAPYYTKILASQNLVYLGLNVESPRSLLCTKPINSLADLNGLKIGASGGQADVEMTQALGASPDPNLINSEVYTALQTGVVTCAWNADSYFDSLKLYEVAKYLYDAQIGGNVHMWTLNRDDWNALTPALQSDVRKAAQVALALDAQLVTQSQTTSLTDLRAGGVTVTAPSPADAAKLAQISAPFAGQWAATGGPDGPKLLAVVRDALKAKNVTATLSSRAEVPRPQGSTARHASARFTGILTPSPTGGTLNWQLQVHKLSGRVTRIQIFRGRAGHSGTLLTTICKSASCKLSGAVAVRAAAERRLYGGAATYVSVATKANPSGEVRGTIKLQLASKA